MNEAIKGMLAWRCVMCGRMVKPGIVGVGGVARLTMCGGCDGAHVGGYYIGYARQEVNDE